ncbi:LysE/ArgO family amino acid transporter [uncultured Campylobacter sp.]|uniref:LysE/ArgO family amino acid transporter n=1 Tax=uncultured Campylobacter sp. TaxID=218934 RepID=UPI0026396DD3|nr:LysE/ArgO family amino acid transporter [uncultured Campylobacter sp.]
MNSLPIGIFLQGAALMLSLIVAIGAQNIFVISQGLAKNHVAAVCTVCALSDAVFTAVGIFLIGGALKQGSLLTQILGIGGIIFLLCYALSSFFSAYKGSHFAKIQNSANSPLAPVVAKALAVTLLNPHVYLDTVVVVGSLGATIADAQKPWFYVGVMFVSFAWFFGLGYGSRALSKLFASSRAWRIIDVLVGVLMLYMAYLIAKFVFKI